jgi:UPF0755 protein
VAVRLLGVLLAAALVGGGLGLWYLHGGPPLGESGALVVVREGDSVAAIADRLHRGGVVRSALLFRVWARAGGLDRAIQPGEYHFATATGVRDVARRLAAGSTRPAVTIPEGRTVREVAALLAAAGLGAPESFLCLARDPEFLVEAGVPGAQLEGYLFPDTYRFSPLMPPGEILGTMVRRFHERFQPAHHRRAAARGMTVDEVVTLASIIEKETGQSEERPLIAAVFHNRLRLGMRLQSDPTVIYGLPSFDGNLTRADLAHPSSYNTYVAAGLPPGPIANPGLAAIEAALTPATASYLYFVSRNDGTHVFSTTLAEHNRAVATYQRGAH